MKRLLSAALLLTLVLPAMAQSKTDVFMSGKNKGAVNSVSVNGALYIDAQAFIKKLGGDASFFASARQLRIKKGSFSAVFTAESKEVLLNGASAALNEPAIEYNKKIYVPASFFRHTKLCSVLDRKIFIDGNRIDIEKNFNVEFKGADKTASASFFRFTAPDGIKISSEEKSPRLVEAKIKNAVLKREITLNLKDDPFINKITVQQCKEDACIRVVTTKDAQDCSFKKEAGGLIFTAGKKGAAAPAAPAAAEQPAPKISQPPVNPVISPIDTGAKISPKKKTLRVVIDPGHGGKDPGAVRKGSLQEKAINLDVAKQLYDMLKKKGYTVKLTRDNDTFLALHERSKISNTFDADLFISIHTNATKRTQAQGFEVYFRSEKATDKEAAEVAALENEALQYEETPLNFVDMLLRSMATNEYINESSKLAGYLRSEVLRTKGIGIKIQPNSAIKQANFYVLRGVDCPAVLVEMGYISNVSDRKQLNIKSVRTKIAEGIADGVHAYAKAEGFL